MLEGVLKKLIIADCDNPSPPKMSVRKVESDEISIGYNIQKSFHASLGRPILKISIEYALVKEDDALWKEAIMQNNEKDDIESDSGSDSDGDSDSSLDNSDSDSDSGSASSFDSDSDEGNG